MNDALSIISSVFSGVTLVVVAGVAVRFGEWKGHVDEKLHNIERRLGIGGDKT